MRCSPVVRVGVVVYRLADGGELHDGVAPLERLEGLVKAGQVRGDEDKAGIVAELGVVLGDVVDADDGVARLEGSRATRWPTTPLHPVTAIFILVSGQDRPRGSHTPLVKTSNRMHTVMSGPVGTSGLSRKPG